MHHHFWQVYLSKISRHTICRVELFIPELVWGDASYYLVILILVGYIDIRLVQREMDGGDVKVCPLSFDGFFEFLNGLIPINCDRKCSIFVGNDASEFMQHFENGKRRSSLGAPLPRGKAFLSSDPVFVQPATSYSQPACMHMAGPPFVHRPCRPVSLRRFDGHGRLQNRASVSNGLRAATGSYTRLLHGNVSGI